MTRSIKAPSSDTIATCIHNCGTPKSSAFRGALDYATFEWKLKEAQPNFNAAMKTLIGGYGHFAK